MEISSKRLGVTAVVENEKLLGIITDGDLRRMFGKSTDMQSVKASEMMSVNPKTAHPEMMAVDALQIMKQFNITSLVVVEGDKYQGFIHLHDLLREGII